MTHGFASLSTPVWEFFMETFTNGAVFKVVIRS